MKTDMRFLEKYGPWALIAGASMGLGAEYASQLAAEGPNVVLVARRAEMFEALAAKIKTEFRVGVRTLSFDLAHADVASIIDTQTSDIEIGLLVYNAAFSAVGLFLSSHRKRTCAKSIQTFARH